MENQRFDTFARALGGRANRREALKWMGGSVLAAIGLARLADAAARSAPGGFGDPCAMVEGSCQAPYTCFEAVCDLPRGCVSEGQPCVDFFPCCTEDGLGCLNGVCAAAGSTLPATGVGIPHDTERVAGLGLAAAAVLVAGKLIRDKERDPEL